MRGFREIGNPERRIESMERRFKTPTDKMIDKIKNSFDLDCLPDWLDEYDGHELWVYNNGARIVVVKDGANRRYYSVPAYDSMKRLEARMNEFLKED